MAGTNEKSPQRRLGAGVCSGKRTGQTLPPADPRVKSGVVFEARFDVPPPKHTRQAQQRVAVVAGHPVVYKARAQVRQESEMLLMVMSRLPAGWTPFDKPVSVSFEVVFPYRRSELKAVVRSGREIPHGVRPDIDNLICKQGLDILERAGVLSSDAIVAQLYARKAWGPRAYWGVRVKALGEEAPRPGGRGAGGPDHLEGRNRPCGQVLPGLEGGAE